MNACHQGLDSLLTVVHRYYYCYFHFYTLVAPYLKVFTSVLQLCWQHLSFLRVVCLCLSNWLRSKMTTMKVSNSVIYGDIARLPFPLHSMRRLFPEAVTKSLSARIASYQTSGLTRFVANEAPGDWCAALRKLPWDSQFFCRGVGRVEYFVCPDARFNSLNVQEGCSFIRKLKGELGHFAGEAEMLGGIDYLTVQVDSSDVLLLSVLQQEGFVVLDTIVCYLLDLRNFIVDQDKVSAYSAVRPALPDDSAALARISQQCFSNVVFNANRFNSDLHLPSAKVAELYALWAARSVSGEMAEAVLVSDDGRGLDGFITMDSPDAFDLANGINLASIPLNAVNPERHGQGIYSALVYKALVRLKDLGADWVEIRTQLSNSAVIRTWQRLGAVQVLSYHTLRYASLAAD